MERVQDVGDCWLDAGVVPFSTLKYNSDKEYWKKWYPADYVTEMIEQVRLWFYSMLVFGTIFENKVPYNLVLGYAELRDQENQRMSKTKPNYIPLDEAADKIGTDTLRWNFVTSSVGANMRFGWPTLEDVRRRFYLILWNTYSYFVTYAKLADWNPNKYDPDQVKHALDKWLVARVKKLSIDVERSMDAYDMATSSREIEEFVKELSTWYIRRCRARFKNQDYETLGTLHYALVILSKLLAPFIPYLSEEIYQNLVVNMKIKGALQSVHHESYPHFEMNEVDQKALESMQNVKDAATLGLSIRDQVKMKLKQPLQAFEIAGTDLDEELLDILKEELNIKDAKTVKKLSKKKGWINGEQSGVKLSINTVLSEDLKKEGMYRELVRQVQNSRKSEGFSVGEKVAMRLAVEDETLRKVVEEMKEQFMTDVSANSLQIEQAASDDWEELKVEGSKISVKLSKIQ